MKKIAQLQKQQKRLFLKIYIEIVENDVGKLVCSYITSTTLLERERGEMKTTLHCLQKSCYDLTMSLNIFSEGL